jgi:hypothetical protein
VVGDVEVDRMTTDLSGHIARSLLVQVADPNHGPFGCQAARDRRPDPAGGPGDQRFSSFQPQRSDRIA